MSELIMCVPRESLPQPVVTGLIRDISGHLSAIDSQHGFIDRSAAETDPGWKQIIPYAIIQCGNKFLTYQRGKAGGEGRLHSKFSIGIGGHVERADRDYMSGLLRELSEEIGLAFASVPVMPRAIVNEELSPVGEVHLGLVYVVQVPSEDITTKCASIVNAQFKSALEMYEARHAFEVWSQLCIEQIDYLKV